MGCTSQKRCLKKFPSPEPVTNTIIAYRDTTLYDTIPGKIITDYVKIEVEVPLPDTTLFLETDYAKAQAGLSSNHLWLDLIQKKSIIEIQLDSVLIYQIDTITIQQPVLIEVPTQTKWQSFVGVGFWVFVGLFMAIVALLIYRK